MKLPKIDFWSFVLGAGVILAGEYLIGKAVIDALSGPSVLPSTVPPVKM